MMSTPSRFSTTTNTAMPTSHSSTLSIRLPREGGEAGAVTLAVLTARNVPHEAAPRDFGLSRVLPVATLG